MANTSRPSKSRPASDAMIYRVAAQKMERGIADCGMCHAVGVARTKFKLASDPFIYGSEHHDRLAGVFPFNMCHSEFGGYSCHTAGSNAREYRVLALCFMAAMVEAGDA